MRTIYAVILVAIASASAIGATDGRITFNITADPGQGNVVDITQPDFYSGDAPGIWFVTDVAVTGNNKGLAGLNASIKLYDPAGNLIDDGVTVRVKDMYWIDGVYKSPTASPAPMSGQGRIVDGGAAGGPGLTTLPQLGTPFPDGLSMLGVALLQYNHYRLSGKAWVGEQTWGVGRADRQSTLLQAAAGGVYPVMGGRFDVSGLPLGTYKLKAFVDSGAVLDNDAPYESGPFPLNGVTVNVAEGDLVGSEFVFTIVPEPATMLLLGIPTVFLRRRRA